MSLSASQNSLRTRINNSTLNDSGLLTDEFSAKTKKSTTRKYASVRSSFCKLPTIFVYNKSFTKRQLTYSQFYLQYAFVQ